MYRVVGTQENQEVMKLMHSIYPGIQLTLHP